MARVELVEYIRRYSGEYFDDTIREKLATSGCTPEEIDEAFAQARGAGLTELPGMPSPGPAEGGAEEPDALRKFIGVALILFAFPPLIWGGVIMGPSFNLLLSGKSFSANMLLGGLLLGAVGAGLMFGGTVLCGGRRQGRSPVQPWKVLLFGLCFPGAAQAYGGRWLRCAFFLLLPWALVALTLLSAVIYGAAAARLGLPPDSGILSGAMGLIMPSKPFYALLWIASLAEGWFWADSLPQGDPQREIPGWPAAVLGLGAISYLFVFFLMLTLNFVSLSLKAGLALKGAAPAAQGADAPAAEKRP